jgi:hypothetical protein
LSARTAVKDDELKAGEMKDLGDLKVLEER